MINRKTDSTSIGLYLPTVSEPGSGGQTKDLRKYVRFLSAPFLN
jgi:hypothetical protein